MDKTKMHELKKINKSIKESIHNFMSETDFDKAKEDLDQFKALERQKIDLMTKLYGDRR